MKTTQHIILITHDFSGGGAQQVIVNLANSYITQGYDVTVITFDSTGPCSKKLNENIPVIDLNTPIKAISTGFKLLKTLRQNKPDIIISGIRDTNIWLGLISLGLANKNIIYCEADTMHLIEQMPRIKSFIYKSVMRLTYKPAAKVIANSCDTQQDLIKYRITSLSQSEVIGNPVIPDNIEELASQPINHAWFNNTNLKVILSVGRLSQDHKNHQMLVRSFANVLQEDSSSRLVILGEGDEYDSLMGLARSLNLEGYFEILSYQDNPYPFYKKADLFVLTSRWEAFGNVLVEAMACQTPVVSTDCPGGPKMILDNGNLGALVPIGDLDALSKQILKLINKGADKETVKVAYEKALQYNIESISKNYLD